MSPPHVTSIASELPCTPRGRTVPLLELPPSDGPLYLAIYKRLRTLIVEGAWEPGTRLPSSRQLAQDLGISRNTAHVAIEQLIAEGWANSSTRCGVFVATQGQSDDAPSNGAVASSSNTFEALASPVRLFPINRWRSIQNRLWEEEEATALLSLDPPAGTSELRRILARLVCASRGILAEEEDVIVTSSVASAVEIVARVVCSPGRPIAIEDPGDPRLAARLNYAGLPHIRVPVDQDGVTIPSSAGENVAAIVASIALQAPTGVCTAATRRDALIRFARDHQAWIVEQDCHGHSAACESRSAPPLRATDSERTIYVRGLDKLVFPGLSLGFILAPRQLVPALVAERQRVDRRLGNLDQLALARFVGEGALAAHLRALRPALRDRLECLRAALQPQLENAGLDLRWNGTGAAIFGPRDVLEQLRSALRQIEWPFLDLPDSAPFQEGAVLVPFAGLTSAEMQANCRSLSAALNQQ